jgi:hypothetical protein
MAYKRGMAFKKAMALAAFQQIPTEEDDLFVQSSLPQTIAEEDTDQLPPGRTLTKPNPIMFFTLL